MCVFVCLPKVKMWNERENQSNGKSNVQFSKLVKWAFYSDANNKTPTKKKQTNNPTIERMTKSAATNTRNN